MSYADFNIASASGALVLNKRIRAAAKSTCSHFVCESDEDEARWMQNTTAKAAAKVNQPALSAVAEALKVTLLGDVSAKIELGGTRSPAALDAYLRASKVMYTLGDPARDLPTAIAEYAEAIRLDPDYALAFAGQSQALSGYAGELATGAAIRRGFEKAEADARRAIARRRPGLVYLRSDPLMDPLPQEPRFKADLRELNFPTD